MKAFQTSVNLYLSAVENSTPPEALSSSLCRLILHFSPPCTALASSPPPCLYVAAVLVVSGRWCSFAWWQTVLAAQSRCLFPWGSEAWAPALPLTPAAAIAAISFRAAPPPPPATPPLPPPPAGPAASPCTRSPSHSAPPSPPKDRPPSTGRLPLSSPSPTTSLPPLANGPAVSILQNCTRSKRYGQRQREPASHCY